MRQDVGRHGVAHVPTGVEIGHAEDCGLEEFEGIGDHETEWMMGTVSEMEPDGPESSRG